MRLRRLWLTDFRSYETAELAPADGLTVIVGAGRGSVSSPDDLALVKGGPAERRTFLDGALVACAPKHDVTLTDLERVLRQRNALLKQAGGRMTPDIAATLDVFDAKLVE